MTLSLATQPLAATQRQRTLKHSISMSGTGVFTGGIAQIRLSPLPPSSGIRFQRVDLPGKPIIPAVLSSVQGTPRCTLLGKQRATIQTVEHLLAALFGCGIDNALIEINGPEIPIGDGSAKPFIELIEQAGVEEADEAREVAVLDFPYFFSHNETHLIALPAPEFRVSYTLHYPRCPLLSAQYLSFTFGEEQFKREIAPSRTFSIYEEIAPLIERGIIRGGSLDNAVLIKDGIVMNPGGLRFPDECVRHKIVDLVGDLSLLPFRLKAHIVAIRTGHTANVAFARGLLAHVRKEEEE